MKVINQRGINPITQHRGSRFRYNGRDYVVLEVGYGQCVVELMTWRHRTRRFFTGKYIKQ